jgi:hypothetical protein
LVTQLSPRAPYDGAGVVLGLHLRGRIEGVCALTIIHARLANQDAYDIPVQIEQGQVQVASSRVTEPDVARRGRR